MKKIKLKLKFSKLYFLIWLLLVLWINYKTFYTTSTTQSSSSTTTTAEVTTWDIKESIETSWTAELANEQSISFNQTGKITKVYFKEWDSVKSWDIIAEIDNSDWLQKVKEAQITLENEKLALSDLYEEASETDILKAQNAITSTKQSIEVAKKELENLQTTKTNWLNDINTNIANLEKTLENSKAELESSISELELSKKELETTKLTQADSLTSKETANQKTLKDIQLAFNSNIIDIKQALEKMDAVLWVTDENKAQNDDYEIYLWAKNTSEKTQATSLFSETYGKYTALKKIVDNYDENDTSSETLTSILNSFINTYESLWDTADMLYKTANDSIETTTLTSSTKIDNIKSDCTSIINSVQSKLSSINNSLNSLKTLSDIDLIKTSNTDTLNQKEQSIKTKELNIKNSELSIEKQTQEIENQKVSYTTKEKEYDLQIQSKVNSIENLEKTLKLNKQSLEELYEWPTSENITKANNSIKQAEMTLTSANKDLEKYQLEAPFEWVIKTIDYQVWDNILSDSDKSVYIENPNLLQISISLDQVDIINVELWNKAIVTFDAYPDDEVDAKVTKIDTTPTSTSWVVTYWVTITLNDEDFKKTILSWMTADIEIITSEKSWVLLVDSSAITTENDKSYLTISKNGKETKTEVVTGLVQDWETEILSGASSWDKVTIKTISASTSTTTTSSTSLLGWNSSNKSSGSMWGWMWGPPGGF